MTQLSGPGAINVALLPRQMQHIRRVVGGLRPALVDPAFADQ